MTEPAQAEAAQPPARPILLVGLETEAAAQIVGGQYEVVRLDQANGHCKDRPVVVYWHSGFGPFPPEAKPLLAGAKVGRVLLADVAEPFGPAEALAAGFDLPKLSAWAKSHGHDYAPEIVDAYTNAWIANVQAEDARRQADAIPGIYDQIADAETESAAEDDAATLALASVLDADRHSAVWVSDLGGDGWPEPNDLWGGSHLPEIRPEHGPAAIMPYLLDQAQLAGVDPAQTLVNGLTVCAGLVAEPIALQMMAESARWVERARLWGAVVGDPSTRKGAGLDIVTGDFFRIAKRLRDTQETELAEYDEQVKLHEHRMREWRPVEAKSPGVKPKPQPPERPDLLRLWTDDATKEKVAYMLSKHARGKIMLIREELAAWFGSFDAYTSGKGEKDKPDWLSAYEGKERYIDRVAEGRSIHVPSWSVGVLGGIQPSVLARIAAQLGHDGMLQRFQIVVSRPASEGEERKPDEAATKRWRQVLDNLLGLLYAQEHGAIRLSPDAQAFRGECSRWINKAMRSGLSPHIVAALGKWEGLYGRLMITSHCIEAADQGRMFPDRQVSLETAQQCWRYMREILWPHALHFYDGILAENDARNPIKWIAGLILVEGLSEISTTFLSRRWSGYRAIKTPQQRKELWDGLVTAGWLKPAGGSDVASKMPTRYSVNPAVLDGRFNDARLAYETERRRYTEIMHVKMPRTRREPGQD